MKRVPLKRGTHQLKRTELNRTEFKRKPTKRMKTASPKTKQREKIRREQYADARGVPFDEAGAELGANHDDWPARRVVTEDGVLDDYRWFMRPCPLCRRSAKLEPHHLVGGAGGRSNEHANLIAICRACHEEVQGDSRHTQRVWLAKWRTDRWHTDWCRLFVLLGRVPAFDCLD